MHCRCTIKASVRSKPSLAGFRQQLKTTLFRASYPQHLQQFTVIVSLNKIYNSFISFFLVLV